MSLNSQLKFIGAHFELDGYRTRNYVIAFVYLRSLIEKTKQNPPSLAEALNTSIKLEEKLSRFHLQNIVKFADSCFRKQFTKVIQAEQERIASFRKAYEQLVAPLSDNSFQCDLTI
jgi:rubrerythrin